MLVKGTVLQDLTIFLQALHTRRVNCNLATVSPPKGLEVYYFLLAVPHPLKR